MNQPVVAHKFQMPKTSAVTVEFRFLAFTQQALISLEFRTWRDVRGRIPVPSKICCFPKCANNCGIGPAPVFLRLVLKTIV